VSVNAVRAHPNGYTLVTAGGDNNVKLWDVRNNQCYKTLEGHLDSVISVEVNYCNIVSGSYADERICFWDFNTGDMKATFDPRTGDVTTVQQNKVPSTDYTSWSFSTTCSNVNSMLHSSTRAITSLQFSDTQLIAGSSDQMLRRWIVKQ
jgi:WD40 repeat protein